MVLGGVPAELATLAWKSQGEEETASLNCFWWKVMVSSSFGDLKY